MNQREKSFMAQFDAAKKDAAALRAFMGESARMAVLSYPVLTTSKNAQQIKAAPVKKK